MTVGDVVSLAKNGVVRWHAKDYRTECGDVPRHDRFEPFDGKIATAAFSYEILTAKAVDHLPVTLKLWSWLVQLRWQLYVQRIWLINFKGKQIVITILNKLLVNDVICMKYKCLPVIYNDNLEINISKSKNPKVHKGHLPQAPSFLMRSTLKIRGWGSNFPTAIFKFILEKLKIYILVFKIIIINNNH